MDFWLAKLELIASDPAATVALVLAVALILDMAIVRVVPSEIVAHMHGEGERRRDHATAADKLRGLDLRIVAQAVEDMIIDRQHLTRILGTRALDLWIDLALEERDEGPTLKTRAKIVAFEPVPLDEARIAQSARMIKRRVAEELTQLLGVEDVNGFVNGGVTIETAIERTA